MMGILVFSSPRSTIWLRWWCKKVVLDLLELLSSSSYGLTLRLLFVSHFTAKICLLTSFRETCFIEIIPQHQEPTRELWLSFWSEVHYNSLYEIRDAPVQYKPRKKHWLF